MWRALTDWVLADTFVIREAPFPVVSPPGKPRQPASLDLLEATASILREREELTLRTQELESQSGDPQQAMRIIKQMIPVLDAMDRVLAYARDCPPSKELDNWLKSVEGVYYRLLTTLERHGLEPVESIGKPVDLEAHEVVEYIPSTEHAHNSVVAERSKGYRFRGKLLRDAKVVVAYNPKNG